MRPTTKAHSAVCIAPRNRLRAVGWHSERFVRALLWACLALAVVPVQAEQASATGTAAAPSIDGDGHRDARPEAAAVLRVRYPHNDSPDAVYAHRLKYIESLLELVLTQAGQPYKLVPVATQTVTGNRNSRNLLSGYYDVNWVHTNIQREQALLPVRIPLFKGATGWRILLIESDDQERFSAIDALEPLKALRAGQGHDWPDTPLLSAHNFSLQTSISRDSLISMLAGKRIDYFPRSVVEAFDELDMYRHENIAIEQTLALMYPTAQYFFVAPDNQRLAEALKKGLEAIIASGDFDELFNRFYGESIARAQLSDRQIFRLTNPLLPKETPLGRAELWLSVPESD